jgi:hypothetical protein
MRVHHLRRLALPNHLCRDPFPPPFPPWPWPCCSLPAGVPCARAGADLNAVASTPTGGLRVAPLHVALWLAQCGVEDGTGAQVLPVATLEYPAWALLNAGAAIIQVWAARDVPRRCQGRCFSSDGLRSCCRCSASSQQARLLAGLRSRCAPRAFAACAPCCA